MKLNGRKALVTAAKTNDSNRLEMQSSARNYFKNNYSKELIIDSVETVLQRHC